MTPLFSRANVVTGSRYICGALMIVGLPRRWSTSMLLAIVVWAWFSDLIDGWLARRDGTQSSFGAKFDQWADASFHALTALGWILASSDHNPLLLAAVGLYGLGSAINPVVFPAATIPFPAAKMIGGGLAFLVDVLLVSQSIAYVPAMIAFAVSLLVFLFRMPTLLNRYARHGA